MTSTFSQQIRNVPLELVKQGWRLNPSDAVTTAWSDGVSPLCRWQYVIRCGVMLARPLRVVAYSVSNDWPVTAYAHEGWGDGLSPTPEMVEMWKYWWVLEDGEMIPVSAVFNNGELFARNWQDIHGDYCTIRAFDFRGPVLPTHGGTSCPLTSQLSESTSKQKEQSP